MRPLPSTYVESQATKRGRISVEEMNAFLDAMLHERARARIKQLLAEREAWRPTRPEVRLSSEGHPN